MALTVKEITLWRREIANRPGTLASTLAPLAGAGANFRVVMGYRYPGDESKAAIEVFPVAGKKQMTAAQPASLPLSFRRSSSKATIARGSVTGSPPPSRNAAST